MRRVSRPAVLTPKVRVAAGGGGGSDPDRASRLVIIHANGGTFPDTSTYARTVTVNGTLTAGSAGKFGAAGGLSDAAGECIYIESNTGMAVGAGALTIAGWFKPTASGRERFALSKGINDGDGWLIGIGTDGVTFRHAGTNDLAYNGSLSSSSWHYVKCVFTAGGDKKIFVNGPEVATQTIAHNITISTRLEVGACVSIGSGFQYQGEWDEIIISALEDTSTTVPSAELPDA